MENQNVQEGKTTGIISYLWWIGLIIAFFMNNTKKNTFASFHIRQSLGLCLFSLASNLISAYVSSTAGWILGIVSFALWIIAFIGVLQGQEKKIPLLGDMFQNWFKTIG